MPIPRPPSLLQEVTWPVARAYDFATMHPKRELKRRGVQASMGYVEERILETIAFGSRRSYLHQVATDRFRRSP
jgi:type VI protein secretion system component VasA